jgi:hypothetical protein
LKRIGLLIFFSQEWRGKKERNAKVGKWKALRALTAVLGNFVKTLGLDRHGLCRVFDIRD